MSKTGDWQNRLVGRLRLVGADGFGSRLFLVWLRYWHLPPFRVPA